MPGPHYIGMLAKYDQIYFPSQGFHHNPVPPIKNSYFLSFQGFQEDYHELYDPIIEWLEQSYLETSVTNNKFQYFFVFSKEFDVDGVTSVRSFQVLLNGGSV